MRSVPATDIKKITILLVDDHKMVTNAIASLLNDDGRFEVIGEAASAEEAIYLATSKKPDIVLIETNMQAGFDIVRDVKKNSPSSGLIGVSIFAMPAYAKKVISAGGLGYVTKSSSMEELIEAIVEVHGGRKFICSEIKDGLAGQLDPDKANDSVSAITPRELEVIGYLKQGLASKEIAEMMNLSIKTIEVHRYNILRKLGLPNVAALVNYINKQGW